MVYVLTISMVEKFEEELIQKKELVQQTNKM